MVLMFMHVCKWNGLCICMYTTGALSMTDNDDDYCVSYTVTMVDVRSCTRPPRLPHQPHQGMYICNICTYVCMNECMFNTLHIIL